MHKQILKAVEEAYRKGLRDAQGINDISPFLLTSQVAAHELVNKFCQPLVSGSVLPAEEMTAAEFFKRINSIPNYTAKNIKMKIQGGWVTIGEMSITTEKVAGKTDR